MATRRIWAGEVENKTYHGPRDLAGRVVFNLTVTGYAGAGWWFCKCACGKVLKVPTQQLISGYAQSCGCAKKDVSHIKDPARSKTRNSFFAARARCNNPKNNKFYLYGARGIKFLFASCGELVAEIGERPHGMTLHRINNQGHYEPGNVKWATVSEQQNNRSGNKFVSIDGVSRSLAEWLGGSKTTTYKRAVRKIQRGGHPEEVVKAILAAT